MKNEVFTLVAMHFGLVVVVVQPVITTQPQSKTVRVGQTALFTVTATGAPPLAYQWRKEGVNIPGATGATGATLALGLARTDSAGTTPWW